MTSPSTWIKRADREPEPGQRVIAWAPHWSMPWPSVSPLAPAITHWMPFPEPPVFEPEPEKPKPCPFCGSDDLYIGLILVRCNNCGAVGPHHHDAPTAAWNRRAPQ